MSLITDAHAVRFGTVQSPINTTCPICLTDWQSQDKVTKLACEHLYCDKKGCLEDITRLANSKCALCRAPIEIDENKAQSTFYRLVQTGRHLSNPNSISAPQSSAEHYENVKQFTRLYGTAVQRARLDRHEAIMADRQRQEDIAKRILRVAAPLLCIGLAGLSYYFFIK